MNKKQKKGYYKLEQDLKAKYRHLRKNELVLKHNDFEGGRLTNDAFMRLADECWYIAFDEDVVIKTPNVQNADLSQDLGFYAARALYKSKKDREELIKKSIALAVAGIAILAITTIFANFMYGAPFIYGLLTIISWTFVWSGVYTFFIDMRPVQDKRYTILQLLSANIVSI